LSRIVVFSHEQHLSPHCHIFRRLSRDQWL
jgi:hypothetical protein